ncbi:MAG TPA: MGMT family protein [Gemmatimonadaceae bacterium]|nr:MGMT family protein [Gemmatimonadaceae bacterium]
MRGGEGRARGRRHAGPASSYERIYAVVRRIPEGSVATYGAVAVLAGVPGQARLVGYALHALPARSTVPWHRVVNARGAISLPAGDAAVRQRLLLVREGVAVDAAGRVRLARSLWAAARRALEA